MKYPIIAFTGRKGAGKDTAASLIAMENGGDGFSFGYNDANMRYETFIKRPTIKFATPLKNMLIAHLEYCGVSDDTIDRLVNGNLKEVPNEHLCGATSRWAQQSLGTEWGRVLIGDKIWLNAFDARYDHLRTVWRGRYNTDETFGVINTDTRFANEEQFMRERGAYIVKVVDPHFVKPENDHPSESYIDQIKADYTFINSKADQSAKDFAYHVARTLYNKGVLT